MLSIDVGSKQVYVIEGTYNNKNVVVTACGSIEYKSEVTLNGLITDRSNLGFLISEIINKNGMKSKQAVISIDSSDIVTREFKLPEMSLVNLRQLVKNEMLRVVGTEIEFIIDFITTGLSEDKMLTILCYAVPRDIIDGYYKLLKELKLKAISFDIHANSISKLLSNTTINGVEPGEGNFIVADIGFSRITFHGFSNGVCKFNRTEISPVQEFMRDIDTYNNSEEMEQLDLAPIIEPEDSQLFDTFRNILPLVSDEIQRYVQYTLINSASRSVLKIYICGGIASIKGIDIALTNALKIPVEVLKSVGKLTLPNNCSLTKACNAAGALIRL